MTRNDLIAAIITMAEELESILSDIQDDRDFQKSEGTMSDDYYEDSKEAERLVDCLIDEVRGTAEKLDEELSADYMY